MVGFCQDMYSGGSCGFENTRMLKKQMVGGRDEAFHIQRAKTQPDNQGC